MLLLSLACNHNMKKDKTILFKSKEFSIYNDRVVQGDYTARIISPHQIVSDYKSESEDYYSSLMVFKFALNGKDNENAPGADHWVIIDGEHVSPVIKFGEKSSPVPNDPGISLPHDYTYTFRVDMSPVFEAFERQGYYETWAGNKISKKEFNGVYIAGNSVPLTWNFTLLDGDYLKLKKKRDNIFQITLNLNPETKDTPKKKEWVQELNISDKPTYKSEQVIVDALFNMSLEEALKNIEPDSTLRTGVKWEGVWTRDISYSIFLAFAYHEPKIARISLMKKVKRGRIIQDTGSGGSWPVSTDRTIWALAAWELYKITGDKNWLQEAYIIIKNTLEDDRLTVYNPETGLYRGESTFLDWREQSYPRWMSNADIFMSENLGTNVIHYQAHVILAEMARILGEQYKEYTVQAKNLKKAINRNLWMQKQGFYAQYKYGRAYLNKSPRFETLGEALAILFNVSDTNQIKRIISDTPITPFGTPCFYPQTPDIPPYHNNAVWPFVQAYWNLAAAKSGNEQALNHGLAAIYRAGALFLTNYENFVAETGDFSGTAINSSRMLWSIAGNLSMVYRVFIGMAFEPEGIYFQPCIPENYRGTRILSNFKYRNSILDISVFGFGKSVKDFYLDDILQDSAFFPAELEGKHHITIEMDNHNFNRQKINITKNQFSPESPDLSIQNNIISWKPVENAVGYKIYKNGKVLLKSDSTSYKINTGEVAEYKVCATGPGGLESFTSEPVMTEITGNTIIIEPENYTPKANLPFSGYTGDGFIELTNDKNKVLNMAFKVREAGTYLIDCRYSNGSGPWNTDNKCAIRSLYINNNYIGSLVFPQRGSNAWSDWGYSNSNKVKLNKGINRISIEFKLWNINMNIDVNKAMLDNVRLIKL